MPGKKWALGRSIHRNFDEWILECVAALGFQVFREYSFLNMANIWAYLGASAWRIIPGLVSG